MVDVVIVGAGHNALVAAAYLAKAGLKPLVLEQGDRVGGCVATGEIAPGFRGPTYAHRAALDATIVRELDLARHGLHVIQPDARACGIAADGRALVLWSNADQSAREIAAFSTEDAIRYRTFSASRAAVGRVLAEVLSTPAPDADDLSLTDLFSLLKTTRRFRGLPKDDAYRLLRWLPMAVADFASEWFESEPLRALVAAEGVLGTWFGPRSAGSTAVLLAMASRDGHPIASGWTARGGPGAIADALAAAARHAGATIRTGARVSRIMVGNAGASGVVLEGGEEIPARRVVSSLDPRRTFGALVDPAYVGPTFRHHVRNIRMRGALTKINYALSRLPELTALSSRTPDERAKVLAGAVRLSANTDAIERAFDAAKYGALPERPWIEFTVPSIADDTLAPHGQHVLSAYVQFTPHDLRDTTWDAERARLGSRVTQIIDEYAPGFASSVIAQQVLTPVDLERTLGLTGGHIFHGELALDQLFVARPLLGCASYQTPVKGLYLCGSGTHPGIGVDGRSGRLAAQEIVRARGRN